MNQTATKAAQLTQLEQNARHGLQYWHA